GAGLRGRVREPRDRVGGAARPARPVGSRRRCGRRRRFRARGEEPGPGGPVYERDLRSLRRRRVAGQRRRHDAVRRGRRAPAARRASFAVSRDASRRAGAPLLRSAGRRRARLDRNDARRPPGGEGHLRLGRPRSRRGDVPRAGACSSHAAEPGCHRRSRKRPPAEGALVRALPRVLVDWPREQLGIVPTPFTLAPALGVAIGAPALWFKREELLGFGFGGNKVRTLSLILADVRRAGGDVLVTGAGAHSNWVRAAAAATAAAQLPLEAVFWGDPPPQA